MNNQLQRRCELFVSNHNAIKNSFRWDSIYMYPLCANIFTEKNMVADIGQIKKCKDLLKKKTGIFSEFRGVSVLIISTLLAIDEVPERKMEHALHVYNLLKGKFFSSSYLPIGAMMIADLAQPEQYEGIVNRTKQIYSLMKKEHPFLTSSEDSTFAALLALSDCSEQHLIDEMERCYQILKPSFFSGNAVQSLSHVLTLGNASAKLKCQRILELFKVLKSNGCKYGTDYELPTLGVLALLDVEIESLAHDIIEVDAYLRKQKGFGIFGLGRKQSLMYAGMLVARAYTEETSSHNMNTAVMNGAISSVIAEQVAIYSAIVASSVASSAADTTTSS